MSSFIQALAMLVALVLAGAGAAVSAQEPPDQPPPPPTTVTVSLRDDRFRPARLTIAAGTTVIWSNDETDAEVAHNVISRDYRWASSDFIPGETYERTFDIPGTYRYFCDLHGGMTGQVVVN